MPDASKRGRPSSNCDDSPAAKKTAPSSTPFESEKTSQVPVIPAKVLVLKQVFQNVSNWEGREDIDSDWEDHFGFKWCITVEKANKYLSVYLVEESQKMCIEGELTINLIGRNADSTEKKISERLEILKKEVFSSVGCDMLERDKLSEYIVDNKLTVQIEFKISFMAQLRSNDSSKFDSSKSKVSNCILLVHDQKFYVSRYFLATHSPYFEALLLGPFKEADKPEVQLPGLDPYDVENFLRVIYGYQAINDHTVEGLLLMADKNVTPIIRERCEDFLVKDSKKNMGKIFDMFLKYNCDMDKIINRITTLNEYKDVIGWDIDRLDDELAKKLLKKSAQILLGS